MTPIIIYFSYARHHSIYFASNVLAYLILISTLGGRHYDYLYFIDEKETCPGSHS